MTNIEKVALKLSVTSGEIADHIGVSEKEVNDKIANNEFTLSEGVKISNYFRSLGESTSIKELFKTH
jgi:plasmid maintenance system antidote protein VapI